MQKRSVVIRRKSRESRPQTKRKINLQHEFNAAGFINPVAGVVILAVFAGLLYVYSINQSAVKGYQIKQIENEIAQVRKENETLKIKEAELKSLYKIEEASKDMNMLEADSITYLDDSNVLAFNTNKKNK